MTNTYAAGAHSAGQSPSVSKRRPQAAGYAGDMSEHVHRLLDRFADLAAHVQERLEEILEHPDDTPAGDRLVLHELAELERELEWRARSAGQAAGGP